MSDHSAPPIHLVFAPDGRRLATSGWDGTVRLADSSTGQEILVLRGHSDPVWGVNFSPRRHALVSAGADGKVLLWDASHPGRGTADEEGWRPRSAAVRLAKLAGSPGPRTMTAGSRR